MNNRKLKHYNNFMTSNKGKRISKKSVKKHFTTIGLFLILYALLALFLPDAVLSFLEIYDSSFVSDDIAYYGIYILILVLGTLVPFLIMQKMERLSFKKIFNNVKAPFKNLLYESVVCFGICILATYISVASFFYLKAEGSLLSCIGLDYGESSSLLYVSFLVLFMPIIEEYVFRGVLLRTLGKFGKSFACLASAIIYALAHGDITELLPAFVCGYILSKLSYHYRSVEPTIAIHILFNALIYVLYMSSSIISTYIEYVIVFVILISIFLVISGRYQRIVIPKAKSYKTVSILFYTRITVILAMLIMLGQSIYLLLK